MSKFHVKKGDKVKVIAGNSKGQQGVILKMIVEEQRAIVEGLNMVTKHIKPTQQNPEGKIEKKEAPIHISNLMLIDPKTNEPTRTGRRFVEVKNKKTGVVSMKLKRFSKKSNQIID
jgi:large subunit ribosomal protein L24